MKIDGRLWIKASGKWLANALQEDIFLPLDLSDARNRTRQRRAITAAVTPSLETAMHALLPQRVVVHVHSVNTLARAVRADAQEHLESRLKGLRWRWVSYVPWVYRSPGR
jgi:rhamnose utilization protein RhaD (predicted bifunctional aldolase and dehydrogenase)